MRRIRLLIPLLALLLAACANQPEADALPPTAVSAGQSATADADHGGHSPGTADANVPYDAAFIDSMIVHHQAAIDMSNQALQESERDEIKTMAQAIIAAQQAEVGQLYGWRKSWYPELPTSAGLESDMGDMEISSDTAAPFDQRFIDAMIAHHEGAISMAKDAETKAERAELKSLARNIIKVQEAEVTQLQEWRSAWFQ
ncbi:MAG TPA: DUF305 domain-containing protein [Roseiflexaceae bacterium]|nr:DUF305 domain-containing protein [Roseiflexaceae bacterium]